MYCQTCSQLASNDYSVKSEKLPLTCFERSWARRHPSMLFAITAVMLWASLCASSNKLCLWGAWFPWMISRTRCQRQSSPCCRLLALLGLREHDLDGAAVQLGLVIRCHRRLRALRVLKVHVRVALGPPGVLVGVDAHLGHFAVRKMLRDVVRRRLKGQVAHVHAVVSGRELRRGQRLEHILPHLGRLPRVRHLDLERLPLALHAVALQRRLRALLALEGEEGNAAEIASVGEGHHVDILHLAAVLPEGVDGVLVVGEGHAAHVHTPPLRRLLLPAHDLAVLAAHHAR
mmetsp:Transcript_20505/g.52574  ORF Transcript_20505/g.52574 Transcript_20505/m.52574 type:complete len:288 (+) Transcript_20505:126-989(+)